jgi:hypothetical protein
MSTFHSIYDSAEKNLPHYQCRNNYVLFNSSVLSRFYSLAGVECLERSIKMGNSPQTTNSFDVNPITDSRFNFLVQRRHPKSPLDRKLDLYMYSHRRVNETGKRFERMQ